MIRFWGNIEAKADAKGRVFLPAVFRKQLQASDRFIMRRDIFENCLVLYPEDAWNKELDELKSQLNKWNSKHQLIFRQYVSDVELLVLDSNGRLLIPKRYLLAAEIHSDVRFVGMDDKIEVWAKEKLDKPFMDLDEFGKAMEGIMKEKNRND